MNNTFDFLTTLSAGYAICGVNGPTDGLLLAVSGGADSSALLHGTVRLWAQHRGRIAVVHVDHQLRADSRRDREHVEELSETAGLECFTAEIPVTEVRSQAGGSLEEVARRLRYEFLEQTALDQRMRFVACAHQQDDQAETILHNIIRGTGIRGLTGMNPVRELREGIQLIRPMLKLRREDVEEFLKTEGFSWQDDESNRSDRHTRNRIRHEVLPVLEQLNHGANKHLVQLRQSVLEVEQITQFVVDRCLKESVLEQQPGICRVSRVALRGWPEPIVRQVLRDLWRKQKWPQRSMTREHWNRLAAAIVDPTGHPPDMHGVEVSVTSSMIRFFGPANGRDEVRK